MKLCQNACLDEESDRLTMGHAESKTKSLKKPCERSRGHIFSPIIMKFGQNFCLDKSSDEDQNGLCQVQN